MNDIIDFTNNGECSCCGGCCTNYLPINEKELKTLRTWVKKHKFVPVNRVEGQESLVFDATCPFMTKDSKCACYKVRPAVCKAFNCREAIAGKIEFSVKHRAVHDLRKEVFGFESMSLAEFELLKDYIEKGRIKKSE